MLDGLNSTIFATTGSNTFNGTQTITGSILQSGSFTSTGTITAQTLVVQTVTSSIIYSSGSNIFGNSLANTQVLTGSVGITGSLNANNVLYVTGSNVGIGTTSPGAKLEITDASATYAAIIRNTTAGGDYLKMIGDSGNTVFEFGSGGTGGDGFLNIYSDNSQKVLINADGVSYFNGGNVGIGTTNPAYPFNVVIPATGSRQDLTNINRAASNFITFTNPQYSTIASMGLLLRVFPQLDSRQGAGIIASGGTNNGATDLSIFTSTSSDGSFSTSSADITITGVNKFVGIGTTTPSAKLDVNGNSIITGSLTVITGSVIEFQVTNTGVKIGNTITDTHTVTGSFSVSGSTTSTSFTGSLFGTSSYASNALTASYALVATSASYAATASVSSTTFGIGATIQTYGSVASSVTGSNNIFTQNTGSFTSAFFKYTAASGSNTRAGEVISVWNSTTTSYTDFSTVDIGNTNNVTASISIVTGQVQFNIQTNSSGWAIKSIATFM